MAVGVEPRTALPQPRRGALDRTRHALAAHAGLVAVLALGAALRVGAAIAYAPALFYSDSWTYIGMAFERSPVGITALRPSGYPLVLRALSLVDRRLELVTAAQHLAGLVSAGLVYAVALRLGARRAVACAAAALVALDAYAIALEQYVLAEAFFTLALTAAGFLALTGRPGACRLAGAGLLLAAAALMRPVALFAVPVWLVYLACVRPGSRAALAGAAALLVPLLIYAGVHASLTGTFALTQGDGWFLYGRVGSIVRCRPAAVPSSDRELCRRTAHDRRYGNQPNYYLFSPRSPAHRAFGQFSADPRRQGSTDAALLRFSLRTIGDRPAAYAALVAGDFARFFIPGAGAGALDDRTLQFPSSARLRWDNPTDRARFLPPFTPRMRAPAAALRAYGGVVHAPRWLLAACAVAAAAALCVAHAPSPRRRALALLLGWALAMLLGAAASGGFTLRYLIPTVPLLAASGALAQAQLTASWRSRRRRPG